MNTREAYQALLAGKKVSDSDGDVWEMDADGDLFCGNYRPSHPLPSGYPYEIYSEPATDEELIAEFERRSRNTAGYEAQAFFSCAQMLKTRKVAS